MAHAAAAQFNITGSLDATLVFTPQYADDHPNDDEDYSYAAASGDLTHGLQSGAFSGGSGGGEFAEDGFENEADGEDAGAAMLDEQIEDEQLLDDEDESARLARKQNERDRAEHHNRLLAAAQLRPLDYVPSKLVGHTYGSTEPWHLRRPVAPLEVLPYIKQGSTGLFEARPARVDFAGFEAGKSYSQTLSIVNVSNRAQRLHLLPPLGSSFRFLYDKKGLLAPGMAEQVQVLFEPSESARVYSDAVRVHALGENLVVPVSAYPVLNRSGQVFPSALSMGPSVGVGRRVSRRVALVSDADVEFEFELRVLDSASASRADFTVFPLRGIIPARGQTNITVDFAPKRAVTSQVRLELRVAQFGFEPVVCTVTGRAHVLQLELPVGAQVKKQMSEREKRLKAAKHLHQLRPTAAAAAASSATPLARPKAAGNKI